MTQVLHLRLDTAAEADRPALLQATITRVQELVDRTRRHDSVDPESAIAARVNLADLELMSGHPDRAAQQARELLGDSRDRLGECHAVRINGLITLARSSSLLGEAQVAADAIMQALACVDRSTDARSPIRMALQSDALPFLDRAGRWSEGEACARESLRMLSEVGWHGESFAYDVYLAHFISRQGRLEEAEPMFEALLARSGEEPTPITRGMFYISYAGHLIARQRYQEAEQRLDAAVALAGDARSGTRRHYPDDLAAAYISLYQAWDRPELARTYESLREEVLQAARQSHD